ncbi:MAG: tRNA adenosine(34) deaminase TadA [Planctomycetota bacterium]|nr:tRNA adenosine(34) deaminase TadA [Planctomycetota bacterium]
MTDAKMMRHAISLAKQAEAINEVPVGAVVFQGDKIVGEGFNRKEIDNDPTAHAEIIAIANAAQTLNRWRLHDCTLVATLEPCPMCAGALVNARIKRIIFGANDPKAGGCRTLYEISDDPRLNHRCEVTSGVLADDCAILLKNFFKSKR